MNPTIRANVAQKFQTVIPDEIWRVGVTTNLLGATAETGFHTCMSGFTD